MKYMTKSKNVRVKYIGTYKTSKGIVRFLIDNGLMMKFLLDEDYSKSENKYYNSEMGLENVPWEKLSAEQKAVVDVKTIPSEWFEDGEVFVYNGKKYVKVNKFYKTQYLIYELLPQIYNDKIFKWKYNKKYKTRETTIDFGMFEFLCIAHENNSVVIDVRYTKCDNRHRNKVTISTIEIENATNDLILDAIRDWKEKFKNDLLWDTKVS